MLAQRAGSIAARAHSVELPRKMSGQLSTKSGRRWASCPGTTSITACKDKRQHLQPRLWSRELDRVNLSGRSGCVKQYALCRAAWMQGLECSRGLAGSLPLSACSQGSAWPASAWLRRNCLSRIPTRSCRKMRRLRLSKDAAQLATLPQFHLPMCTGALSDRHHHCRVCATDIFGYCNMHCPQAAQLMAAVDSLTRWTFMSEHVRTSYPAADPSCALQASLGTAPG